MIRPHEGGVTKPFENQVTCDDKIVNKKIPIPTNPTNLFYTLLSPLALPQCQMCPCLRWRVGQPPERVTEIVAYNGEVRHVPDGGGGNFGQYIKVGTASVARERETTKSGYLKFDPGGK